LSKRRSVLGQGIVEFALVLPIFLTIVLGIFELGRAVWVYSAISTAVREAARYGSSVGETDDGTPHYIDCAGMRAIARQHGLPGNVQDADILISYDRGPGTAILGSCPVSQASIQLGNRVIVSVSGHYVAAAYLPLFDLPEITFTSDARRSIVKALILYSNPVISTPWPTATP
jgi:hypothetical protein